MPMPRMTIGRMILGAALVAACTPFCLAMLLGMEPKDPSMNYARGYGEAKFNALTLGMSPAEVEAAMGKPLFCDPRPQDPSGNVIMEIWWYTSPRSELSDLRGRGLKFIGGRSVAILR